MAHIEKSQWSLKSSFHFQHLFFFIPTQKHVRFDFNLISIWKIFNFPLFPFKTRRPKRILILCKY
jgi:hypothetical protein